MATATISYLGELRADGSAHDGWAGGKCYDGNTVPVQSVPPTVVQLPHDLPIQVGWGDRPSTANPRDLAVWCTVGEVCLTAADSRQGWAVKARRGDYDCALPDWFGGFVACVVAVRDAANAAYRTRADVRTVFDHYARIIADIDRQHRDHAALWATAATKIAKRFRRKSVVLGEQTVPGLVCVRSTRGKLLGYADCWNGVWQGKIQRVRS